MSIDLYTDASSYHATKAGAWAAILCKEGRKPIETSGPLKGDVRSSTSAEARAVANALHHFIKSGDIRPASRVRIICDNLAVVHRINDHRRSKTSDIQVALMSIREMELRHGLTLSAMWVKGHQKKADRDFHADMNARCDKLAGEHSIVVHHARQGAANAHA